MQEQKYEELGNRSTDALVREEERRGLSASLRDQIRKLEARQIIEAQIQEMRDRGEALTLTEEEIKLLESFRRFKLRMRKDGEVFTWQTCKPEGVEIVSETALVIHPSEA